jgi:DNA repair protein RadC
MTQYETSPADRNQAMDEVDRNGNADNLRVKFSGEENDIPAHDVVNFYADDYDDGRVGEQYINALENRGADSFYIEREVKEQQQPGFTVTPAMREKASGGMALFEPKPEYVASERKKKYTPNDAQFQLFLDSEPDPSQAGPGIDAARRAAVEAVGDIHRTQTDLGLALSSDYAARQRVSLVGQKVGSIEDLAVLAQVYRDPRFETFRIVFTDGKDNVVSQVGVTSRLPGSATTIIGNDSSGYLANLAATAKKHGATKFYMLHNHPSGTPTPSRDDIMVTRDYATRLPGLDFRGHVVIDTNKYAVIDRRGAVDIHEKDFGQVEPLRDAQYGNFQINHHNDIMLLAKQVQVDEDAVTLVMVDSQFQVKGVTTLPASAILNGNKLKIGGMIARASLKSHGSLVLAVGRNLEVLQRMGHAVVEAVHIGLNGAPKSLVSIGAIPGDRTVFPRNRRSRLSADTSPEFAYLRHVPKSKTGGQMSVFEEPAAIALPAAPTPRKTVIIGQAGRQYTERQRRGMKSVGFELEVPTLKDRAQAIWKDAGKKLAQGVVDQFAPVKDLDGKAYGLLRLAKGASGAFETFLNGGKLKLSDNVYDYDETQKGGVIEKLLKPLQGEHHDFMRWVAANRAERLMKEGKENLFTREAIEDIKTLAEDDTDFNYTIQNGIHKGQVTRARARIYADSLVTFNGFNKNILDMAEQSGLIDGESRHLWEHEFYVPFYRVADEADGGIRGANIKGGVVRQQAFKALKGGTNALNADLLDNTLMNWAHLLDAAAKNRGAKATIEAAERMGVATSGNQETLAQMGASINNKHGIVWFMDDGVKRYSLVDDPYIMTALTSLEYAGMRNPVMNAMGAMKHALTVGVTASPFFKIRNLIRDSVQVIGTSSIGVNPLANIANGWKLTDPKSDAYFRLLAGGGTIHFGTMMEGSEAKRIQALVESGVDRSSILDGQAAVTRFYRKFIEPRFTAYNELGNRGEAVNRASLYDQLVRQGMDHAQASLQARDLMDFSMQGSFTAVRFLTQTVPFLNARLQGLYKLGRAAKEDPARMAAVMGATAVFSLMLLAAFGDDDDWKKREEWDRNNFWWFKVAGTAFRIPKPFEIGAAATLAERGFELAFDEEMTGTRFRKQVLTLLSDNLSMNPIPQLVKPMIDVYANTDSFSGRPIETMSMERLLPEYRFTDRTSMTARGLSTAANTVAGAVGAHAPSPVQIDHMLRGYFGWLGSFIVGSADVALRPITAQPDRPAPDYWKVATGSMVSELKGASSRYVSSMYDQAREIEQAYGTWRALNKEGKTAEAAEFFEGNRAELSKYHQAQRLKKTISGINQNIRVIERSDMDGAMKRQQILQMQERKDRLARQF